MKGVILRQGVAVTKMFRKEVQKPRGIFKAKRCWIKMFRKEKICCDNLNEFKVRFETSVIKPGWVSHLQQQILGSRVSYGTDL